MFANYHSAIDEALRDYTRFGEGCPQPLQDAIDYSLLSPGKRIRPVLTLCVTNMCGTAWRSALPAAVAIEMVHAYSLIHDDLPAMDDDDLRRGRPSCHIQFGEAIAILAGDALLTGAFQVLAEHSPTPEIAMRCSAELARAAGATGMVGGQADDLSPPLDGQSIEFLESIHRRKTAAMIRAAVRMGAWVASASDGELKQISRFGMNLGLAFQIVDDLLDATGHEATVGKRTQKDVESGKWTFPRLVGIENSWRRAEGLIEEACAAIASWGPAAEPLRELAHIVMHRKS